MQIELGTQVLTQDDRDAGVIKHLILDPQSEQVKTVVIEKGLLLHNDVEVPLSALQVLASKPASSSHYSWRWPSG